MIFALINTNRYGKEIKVVFDGFCPYDLSTYNIKVEFAGDADARIINLNTQQILRIMLLL